ncbi:putative phosphoesterase, ICC [Caldisphaera lagunensis DSM 15908]|uniref:Putative phosphoesterase, ICC n=1 Tax=Caldisphaera lagunensis (strain DSM 15908 / JCM 11604 / ANMR 0165 / IC-154) TaxID=1056495 RepID=L0A934_CALLD|nr:metallophosphoesterase [Caldisphaera lagunensis]AFZ69934.1 putative phosphoesterase, ICC [Caldisphaera lagunensis DSM 15908]
MKFLLVSDIHKSNKMFKGINEYFAIEWLLNLIDDIKPDVLISAGDWDEGMSENDFIEIERKVTLITIYGNHENFPLIIPRSIQNGKIYDFEGLKISGLNGLIEVGRTKKNNESHYLTTDDAINIARKINRKLKGSKLNIFISHQPPYLPDLYPNMRKSESSIVMLKLVEMLRPSLFFNGHMTGGCYSYYEFPNGTKYLRVDSSQQFKCYAILTDLTIDVYEEKRKIFSFNIS